MSALGHWQQEIEAKAADWVVRLGGGPLPDETRRRLESWLAESPAHEAAFDHARSVWADLAALRTAPGALAGDTVPRRRSAFAIGRLRPGGAMVLRAAAIAALILAAGSFGAFWFGNPLLMLEADYRTAPGRSRSVALADGSTVQLNTDSALAVRFDGRERRVELLSGEAYFVVAPMRESETRPFVVASANGTATAKGTQFIVERDGGGTQVIAAEHRVQVSAALPDHGEPGSVVLSPGQSVRYDGVSGMGAVTQVDLDQVTAWRRGRLIFDKVRLAEVVAALNRYRRGRIVIADAGLADHRVSGVFKTSDPAGALASIVQELGARTVALPPFMTILY